MGFFSEIAYEARRGMTCEQTPTPIQQAAISPPPATSERKPASPAVAPVSAPASSPSPTSASAPEPTPSPTPASSPVPVPTTSPTLTLDLSADADAADEAERKRAHEAAEAKRKAEWEAKQATKRAAEKEQLDKLAAMTDEAAIAAAVNQVHAATDRMTNRSMKDSVSAHIQALCRADPAFARLTMHPRKSMLHCIQYIYRHAKDYLEKELKASGIKVSGTYGGDVEPGLVYEWAEKYFRDENAKEDHADDEKFVPHTYIPSTRKASKAKTAKKSETNKPAPEKPKAPALEQMSLI